MPDATTDYLEDVSDKNESPIVFFYTEDKSVNNLKTLFYAVVVSFLFKYLAGFFTISSRVFFFAKKILQQSGSIFPVLKANYIVITSSSAKLIFAVFLSVIYVFYCQSGELR